MSCFAASTKTPAMCTQLAEAYARGPHLGLLIASKRQGVYSLPRQARLLKDASSRGGGGTRNVSFLTPPARWMADAVWLCTIYEREIELHSASLGAGHPSHLFGTPATKNICQRWCTFFCHNKQDMPSGFFNFTAFMASTSKSCSSAIPSLIRGTILKGVRLQPGMPPRLGRSHRQSRAPAIWHRRAVQLAQ